MMYRSFIWTLALALWVFPALAGMEVARAITPQVRAVIQYQPPATNAGGGPVTLVDNCTIAVLVVGGSFQNSPLNLTPITLSANSAASVLILMAGAAGGFGTVTLTGWTGGGAFTAIGAPAPGADTTQYAFGSVNAGAAIGGTITLNWTGSPARIAYCVVSWAGTKTASVAAAFTNYTTTNGGTVTTPSVTITTNIGDVAQAWYADDSNNTSTCSGISDTTLFTTAGSGRAQCANYKTSVGSSTTLSATLGLDTATNVVGFAVARGP